MCDAMQKKMMKTFDRNKVLRPYSVDIYTLIKIHILCFRKWILHQSIDLAVSLMLTLMERRVSFFYIKLALLITKFNKNHFSNWLNFGVTLKSVCN